MCRSCSDIKDSFFVRKIIIPTTILVNLGLTIYFVISNAKNYEKYQNRSPYVVYYVPNTTSNYYIVRANLNGTTNCSSNALFTFDVTTVYKNIISKEGTRNILFITVFWLSTIVAVLLSLFDILLTIMAHCIQEESEGDNAPIGFALFILIGSQFLKKGSFIFPTYFIGIFDYTQLCLPHHTTESSFILHHTYICIAISLCSMIYLVLWTWACREARQRDDGTDPAWIKCLETVTCGNDWALLVVLFLLCLAVLPIGAYGMFVWVTALMEYLLSTKAILIGFNFILGALHDIIMHCKH